MDVLWETDDPAGLNVRDVMAALPERSLAYTTVMTVLTRLVSKGFLTRKRDGRAWRYVAVDTREELTGRAMRDPLSNLPHAEQHTAILHFIEGASDDELEVLKAALAKVEARGGRGVA